MRESEIKYKYHRTSMNNPEMADIDENYKKALLEKPPDEVILLKALGNGDIIKGAAVQNAAAIIKANSTI